MAIGKSKGRMSLLNAAIVVLEEAKEPLCAKDITRAILDRKLAETSGRTPHATLSAAISREMMYKGKHSRFCRPARGRFALTKTA